MEVIDGRNCVKCHFWKYALFIECDPVRQLVYVRYIKYEEAEPRVEELRANPTVLTMPFIHGRDLRALT